MTSPQWYSESVIEQRAQPQGPTWMSLLEQWEICIAIIQFIAK